MAKIRKNKSYKIAEKIVNSVIGLALLLLFLGLIFVLFYSASHGATACSEEQASKAAEAYKACVQMEGSPGELGGYRCGLNAYKTYCVN